MRGTTSSLQRNEGVIVVKLSHKGVNEAEGVKFQGEGEGGRGLCV